MREYGCTRVELGVQIIDNKVYKKINRGHTVEDIIKATEKLKNAGFKIGYHLMPGLPGSNPKKDIELFKKLFSNEKFKPDQIKIYPCQVMPCSRLEKIYWKGNYKPYTKKQTIEIITKMIKKTPRYCRIMRIMREIPPEYLIAGVINIDLRKGIEEKLRKEKAKIKEIRYREIGFAIRYNKEINKNLKLKITKYKASKGKEYFLEIINKDDILFGLLRLRIMKNKAIIRELHVYGQSLRLGVKGKFGQHTGLGKTLIKKAEEISLKNNCKKISIISGVGVREYYKKLGYKLEESYMVNYL
jgi:elongator complex protein 3